MKQNTILIVDDERGYAESLQDALDFEGYKVFTATTVEEALNVLKTVRIDLATIDIMMPAGPSLESTIDSQFAGIELCKIIKNKYPYIYLMVISVISDQNIIKDIQKLNVRFFKKGEVPLRTLLDVVSTRLRGRTFG